MSHRGHLSRCDSVGMSKGLFVTPAWFFLLILLLSPGALAKQRLLVFMLDGFRWDYFDREGLPGWKAFLSNSIRVEYLRNSFPTISFPNYYTIMTGLYSEDHGFIDNTMYDPVHKTEFLMGANPEHYAQYWWDDGEPVWITARKQGKKSYMYFWPGCEVTIRKHKPNYCREYKGPPTMSEFRDAIWDGLNAFLDGSADLVAIYFELTDKVGHMFGPDSFQLKSVLSNLGDTLETMLIQMKIMHLTDSVNVLLVSDHGMTNISPKRVIDLNHALNMKDIQHMYGGTFFSVWPHENKVKKVYESLKNYHKNLTVFYKHEIPDRWHLKNHYRVPPIVAIADIGYYIIKPPDKHFPKVNGGHMGGYHGYDNMYPDMRGIFVASGPDFKKNEVVPWINAVDIYQLMCKLLEIKPAPHRGDWANIAPMLRRAEPLPPPSPKPTSPPTTTTTSTTTSTAASTTTIPTTTTSTTTKTTKPPTTLPTVPPKTTKSATLSQPSPSPATFSVSFLSSTPLPAALPSAPSSTSAPSTEPPTSTMLTMFQSTDQPKASVMSLCRPSGLLYILAAVLICEGILG